MIEYTKYQWIDQKHHIILQWARNTQTFIRSDNELKFIYLLKDGIISTLCCNCFQCRNFPIYPALLLIFFDFVLSQY